MISDHSNLQYFTTTKVLTRRQARWSEYLGTFQFILTHRAEKRNPADAPSRRPDYKDPDAPELGNAIKPFFKGAQEAVKKGREATVVVLNNIDDTWALATSMNTADNMVDHHGPGPALPRDPHNMSEARQQDAENEPELKPPLTQRIRAALSTDSMATQAREYPGSQWTEEDGLLFFQGNRLYVPDSSNLRLDILREMHDLPVAGHFGRDRTLTIITQWFYWPGMSNAVREYMSTCKAC